MKMESVGKKRSLKDDCTSQGHLDLKEGDRIEWPLKDQTLFGYIERGRIIDRGHIFTTYSAWYKANIGTTSQI